MLQSLYINNYALIDRLSIDFNSGFNIITGETGAGKSILLGALGLILGQRADLSVLRDKSKKCTVEGSFEVKNYQLTDFFAENELDYDDQTILRREITPSGKSRAFINDTPVNLKTIRELALRLIDIHSQHQNLELGNRQFQLNLVDLVAQNQSVLKSYQQAFRVYSQTHNEYTELLEKAEQAKKDLDYYQFQFNQLDEAKLKPEEQEELEAEQNRLEHAEDIKLTFGQLADDLEGDETGLLTRIKEHVNRLGKMADYFDQAGELNQRLESCYIELQDLADESQSIAERIEHDPARVELVAERLDLIYSLQQKFHADSVAGLVEIREDLDQKIGQVASYDETLTQLEVQLAKEEAVLNEAANELTESRMAVTDKFQQAVVSMLQKLGMANAVFQLSFAKTNQLGMTGGDEVRFLFNANKNAEAQEISKIASGGEMSRLMLALKSLITDSKALPTIIFDEIDTGISGEIAVKMGDILKSISARMQVINITHLPQIAAKGDHHYQVYKFDEKEQTFTSIRKLEEHERVDELAQMLSGDRHSDTARETARELLE
ncbi:DNA repair protein RecN [Sunxiuqinia elliptica]|uniref:DNA repair protein RecN n=1 Tax=Sunxiuqinia elliptica TaxID=655355 RepID=A0A4R6GN01_9BACT|nr:DNA repair protein RecN [Sunxiuqinia elliptica]TDN95715.1 DNA replication and repair protein RecN [Sunxiuqinia elliptica]TDO66910.1 DNA replication and repair protein RecN [Sunxiuqinia elliptica]